MCFRINRIYLLCGHTELSVFVLCSRRCNSLARRFEIVMQQKEKPSRSSSSCPCQTSAEEWVPGLCPMCNGDGQEIGGSAGFGGFGREFAGVDSENVTDEREPPPFKCVSSDLRRIGRPIDENEVAMLEANTAGRKDSAPCSCDSQSSF